jgi:hypothetical protein
LWAVAVMAFGAPSLARIRRKKAPSAERLRVETLGGHPQGFGHPMLHMAGLHRQDGPARDAVVGADRQPRGKVVAVRELAQVGAEFGEEGIDCGGVQAGDLREVDPENPVQLGAEIEARRVALGLAMGRSGWREWVRGRIDLARERGEQALDLPVALGDQLLVVPVRPQGLPQGEEMFGPVVPDQGLGDRVRRSLDPVVAVAREHLRIPFAREDRLEDGEAGPPGDVAQHMVELEVHLGQGLLHVLDVDGAQLDEAVPVPE